MIKDRDDLVELMARSQFEAFPRYVVFEGEELNRPEWDDKDDSQKEFWRRQISAALDAMEAAGVVPVPAEATEEMVNAMHTLSRPTATYRALYAAAIAAIPYRSKP